MRNKKNVSIRALPELGGGLPLPEFFCALFLLKEKVSSMVATAERVGKVARIGGWGLANSGNARIETFFFVLPSSLTPPFNLKDSKKSNILFFQAQIFGEPGRKDSLGRNSDGVHLRGPAGSEVFTRVNGNLIKDVIYNI